MDVSKFNALLCNIKTVKHDIVDLRKEVATAFNETHRAATSTTLDRYISHKQARKVIDSEYLNTWFHPEALHALLAFRDAIRLCSC